MSRPTSMVLAAGAIALATAFVPGALAQQRVYRWTDAQGVVHYSQTEPENVRAEARDMKSRAPRAKEPEADVSAQKSDAEKGCEIARRNRDLLAGSGPVAKDTNGDGKPEVMTDAERVSALAQSEAQVARFCKKAPPTEPPRP